MKALTVAAFDVTVHKDQLRTLKFPSEMAQLLGRAGDVGWNER